MKDYTKLKENSTNRTNEYSKLRLDQQQEEINQLKFECDRLMKEKNQLCIDYETQIRELKEKIDKDDLDRSTSSDFSKSSDLGQKLREQVILTKELDARLITEFNKNSSIKSNEPKQLPDNIKVICLY